MGAVHFNAPVRFVLGGSGHIAGVVNPPAANKYGYWINPAAKLAPTAEEWLTGAVPHEGSWWVNWQGWVTGHSDAKVDARDPAKGALEVLEEAPGSYVKFRL